MENQIKTYLHDSVSLNVHVTGNTLLSYPLTTLPPIKFKEVLDKDYIVCYGVISFHFIYFNNKQPYHDFPIMRITLFAKEIT